MATELEIRVTAELREIKAALAGLQRDIGKVGTSANAGAASGRALTNSLNTSAIAANKAKTAAGGIQGAIAGAVGQVKLLVGGLGAAALGASLISLADTATRLRGQLGLVTKGQTELAQAMAGTFGIAQRTRQGLEATVNLYARVARSAHTSQAATLALTETIQQAVGLSFTTADAAQAALFQLGQGLGSGTLRGEELNSVLEQTPRLAQAIAEGLVKLGEIKDPGGLRAYANKQGIDAQLVVKAIQTQQATLREEFAKLPPTISDAFVQLKNGAIKFVGEIDKAEGASRTFANAIKTIADNLQLIGNTLILAAQLTAGYYLAFKILPGVLVAFGLAIEFVNAQMTLYAPRMIAANNAQLLFSAGALTATSSVNTFSLGVLRARLVALGAVGAISAAFGILAAAIAGYKIGEYLAENFLFAQIAGIKMARTVHVAIIEVAGAFRRAGAEIRESWNTTMNYLAEKQAATMDQLATGFEKIGGGLGEALASRARAAAAEIRGSMRDANASTAAAEAMRKGTLAEIAKVNEGYNALEDAAYAAQYKKDEALAAPAGDTTDGSPAGKAAKKTAESFELLKDAAERALRQLERTFTQGEISTKAYYAEKTRLQEASIDADLKGARSELAVATTADERKKALIQITLLERARRDVAVKSAEDQADAEKTLAQQLQEVANKLLELDGHTAEAKTKELEAQYRDLIKRLEADSDTAGVTMVKKLINVEAAKAGLDQLSNEFSKTTSALGQIQATTAAQVSAGLLSNSTAEKRLAEARTTALAQVKEQRVAVQALYDTYKDPAALQQLLAMDQEIAQLSISTEDFRGKIQDAGVDSLTTFFKELASGAVSASDAVRNLAVNFTQALAAMAAQALAKKAINAIFDAFGSKGGEDGGATQVAGAAAAGLAYAAPVSASALAMTAAGATLITGAAAVTASAAALSAAATALLIANSASFGVVHSGGVVGTIAGSMRNINPAAFIGAPRLHTGGIAGVRASEVATILQRGEEVITKTDPRHRYNGGKGEGGSQGPSRVTTPIVAIGDAAVADAMAGAAGEDVVLTHVRRNWQALSQGGRY